MDLRGLWATQFSNSLFETSLDLFNSFSSLDSLSQEFSSLQQSTSSEPSNDKRYKKRRYDKNNFNKLNVLSLNCNSIKSQHKSGPLKTLVDSKKPHIILGCESKLDSSISSSEVFPQDYEIFHKDRISDNPGGGVFIAVHNTVLATHQPSLDKPKPSGLK